MVIFLAVAKIKQNRLLNCPLYLVKVMREDYSEARVNACSALAAYTYQINLNQDAYCTSLPLGWI